MTAKIIEFRKNKHVCEYEGIPHIEVGVCDEHITLFQDYAKVDKGNIIILERSEINELIECLKEYVYNFDNII